VRAKTELGIRRHAQRCCIGCRRAGRQDRLGAFHELSFSLEGPGGAQGAIRTYVERPVLLFAITSTDPTPMPR